MRRKASTGLGVAPAVFDGRKVRSALKWKILATLLGRVAAPLAAAHVYEFIRTGSSRNVSEWLHRIRHPSHVYVYLRRMAQEGLVTLDRLEDALVATLTERGRRELERYSAYWQERGIASSEALDRSQRGGASDGRTRARSAHAVASEPEGGRAAGRNASQVGPSTQAGRGAEAAPPRDGPATLAAQCAGRISRRRSGGRAEGFGGSTGFVSFDLPMPEHGRRRRLLAVLKAGGYSPVHASMYAGPGFALKAVIQTLEGAGFAPHLRWGSLRLMER